jgi:hypothetical protein
LRVAFEHATGLDDVLRQAGALSARTLVFDIEPLVAYWDGGQEALDQGIARVLDEVAALPAVQVVCFATNSSRRPSVAPSKAGLQVVYLASVRHATDRSSGRSAADGGRGAAGAAAVVHPGGLRSMTISSAPRIKCAGRV